MRVMDSTRSMAHLDTLFLVALNPITVGDRYVRSGILSTLGCGVPHT